MSTVIDEKYQTIYTLLDNGSLIITNLISADVGVRIDSKVYSY